MNLRLLTGLALLTSLGAAASHPLCSEHGGVARQRKNDAVCADGTVDKRTPKKAAKQLKRELHFKSMPDRGQVLNPGEKAPPAEPDVR